MSGALEAARAGGVRSAEGEPAGEDPMAEPANEAAASAAGDALPVPDRRRIARRPASGSSSRASRPASRSRRRGLSVDLARRQRGYGRGARQQIERSRGDRGGVRHGRTIGSPILLLIENRDGELDAGHAGRGARRRRARRAGSRRGDGQLAPRR